MTTSSPGCSALILMDYQDEILTAAGCPASVVENAVRAARAARGTGWFVAFVRTGFQPGYPDLGPLNRRFARVRAAGGLLLDRPQNAITRRLSDEPSDAVLIKTRIDAFHQTGLHEWLQERGVQRLALAGVTTSGCVLATLRGAADRDYECAIIEDACFDPHAEAARVLVDTLLPREAWVGELAAMNWAPD